MCAPVYFDPDLGRKSVAHGNTLKGKTDCKRSDTIAMTTAMATTLFVTFSISSVFRATPAAAFLSFLLADVDGESGSPIPVAFHVAKRFLNEFFSPYFSSSISDETPRDILFILRSPSYLHPISTDVKFAQRY